MFERGGMRARASVVLSVIGLALALAMMFWFWRNGGVRLPFVQEQQSVVEECGGALSGSSTIGLRLAPTLVADFLRQGGYQAGEPENPEVGVIRIVGRRGNYQCTIEVRAHESTTGFRELASGEALVALSSRPILPHDIEALRAGGAGDFEAELARAEHVIAHDAMAVSVHASNPVREVTLDQVRLLGLGRTESWSAVGGANAPVHMFGALEIAGPDDFPSDLVQSGDLAWANAQRRATQVMRDDLGVIEAIAGDRFAVGFVSASFARDPSRVRDLRISAGGASAAPSAGAVRAQAYPIARRLFFYVRPRDMQSNAFVQRFVAYATSPQAFDRIDELGFIALRPESTADANAAHRTGCRLGAPESAALASALRGAERLPEILRFRANTTELNAAALSDLERLAPTLSQKIVRGDEILLVGHADIAGPAQDNRELGLERALVARAAFEAAGVYGLQVESAGEMCPIADTETAAGRVSNRRVEIWVRPRAG